ncbi:glycosyltransferase family 2 protein [Paenibacillus koleovorans]|uniref:glycosyltransferase family 2 protein n=1 Tax=Paenibacillus koleovorans TaxID=121608 RepID=UPI0013E2A655|nr:glycosyltransferase [Paenibacillus koleovorans]
MKAKVSIIIPSYNRYPLNLFTLRALERQSFKLSEMEVILIDDASTDATPLLADYMDKAPFAFRYVRHSVNVGRSAARNAGIRMAGAPVIIGLDAEIIVGPDFVRHHYRHHQDVRPAVVIGDKREKLYSTLFRELNSSQVAELAALYERSPLARRKIRKRLEMSNQQPASDIATHLQRLKEPKKLLQPERLLATLAELSVPSEHTDHQFAQVGSQFKRLFAPWLLFGSNHSFPKQLAESVGGFDEKFSGWGLEDIEFAYRLHQAGAQFKLDRKLSRYHQEHPILQGRQSERLQNIIYFQEKFPNMAGCVKSLSLLKGPGIAYYDRLIGEYDSLGRMSGRSFDLFRSALILMIQCIPHLYKKKENVRNLLHRTGFTAGSQQLEKLVQERTMLAAHGRHPELVRLFDELTGY